MKKSEALHRLLALSGPYRFLLIGALVLSALQVMMTLWAPVVIGQTLDVIAVKGQGNFAVVMRHLVMLAMIVACGALFQYASALCLNAGCARTVRDLRKLCFSRFHRLPLNTLDQGQQGDFMNTLVNDIDVISDGLLQGATQLFGGVITIFGTLGLMVSIHPLIALVVVLMTPLSMVVASLIASRTSALFKRQAALRGRLSGFAQEMISHQQIVAAYNHQSLAQQQFDQLNEELRQVGVRVQLFSSLTNPCTRFVNNLVYGAVGILGAGIALQGGISVGQLSSFLSYASQYTRPFNEISGVATELQAAFSSLQRVCRLLDLPLEETGKDPLPLHGCTGTLSLQHVGFRYRPDTPLIDDFCLEVRAGQKIAIVGPTGCGKTTLINLLMRFYEIQQRQILLDGVDTRRLSRHDLRRCFGMVLQDSWIFRGTVHDNIAYGRPDATRQQVKQAACDAHLDFFIRQLADGYDTVLDENVSLSQGQRQLLCIARVMLCDPKILILDEATSSIDTRTELLVQSAFDRMMAHRTSLIVAHRLSTIEQADVILVMNQGKVVERGTHHELLRQHGFYWQLYHSQFSTAL